MRSNVLLVVLAALMVLACLVPLLRSVTTLTATNAIIVSTQVVSPQTMAVSTATNPHPITSPPSDAPTHDSDKRNAAQQSKDRSTTEYPSQQGEKETAAAAVKPLAQWPTRDPVEIQQQHFHPPLHGIPPCALAYLEANYQLQEQAYCTPSQCRRGEEGAGSSFSFDIPFTTNTSFPEEGSTSASSSSSSSSSIRQQQKMRVYMIHYSKNKKRRKLMTELLGKHKICSIHWVLGFDREDLSPEMVRCFHTHWQPDVYARQSMLSKKKRHDTIPFARLKMTQVSVVVKHHSAFYDIVRNNYSAALILEDDAFLRSHFVRKLQVVMTELPPDFDIVMIGGCMRMFAYRKRFKARRVTKHLWEKPEARCAHAFVVSNRAARAFLNAIPLTLPIDFQITAAIKESGLRTYWVEPWLSIQGDLGECVTQSIGAPCLSVTKGYDRHFDANLATQSEGKDVPFWK